MEQSDTAQCPTLLHGKPPAVKGDDTAANMLPENPASAQLSQEGGTGKRNIESSKEKVEIARRRNTVLRFQAEVPANVQEEVQRRIAGFYCPVAAAYRVISCAQWNKEQCQHYAPFPKQAALVLAAVGYNIREAARAKLAHILGLTYLQLASATPLELQSFTEVYSKAIWAIPAKEQYTMLVQIHCKCSMCQQPQPILALPLHSEQDSSDQISILADLGQLADLAIACMQQNLSPRNDTCKLAIQRLPSFFCLLTQKTQKSSFAQVCKSEADIQSFLGSTVSVMQQAYIVVALVLHDPSAKHYLVLHHAKEQAGDSILLYDSIYGVRKENLWAQLTKAEHYIEAIFIRSVCANQLYPATALINSFNEIIRHHADPSENAEQHISRETLTIEQAKITKVASWDSPVPSATYMTITSEDDFGLPNPSCAHLLPQAEECKSGTEFTLAQKGKLDEESEHQASVSLQPDPSTALATQLDSASLPEVHSIATDSDEEQRPQQHEVQTALNSEKNGSDRGSQPLKAKPDLSSDSQMRRVKKSLDKLNNAKPVSKRKDGKVGSRNNQINAVSSEDCIQVALGVERYIILSLFDGCGISRAVTVECLKQQPVAAVSAESDSVLRALICHKYDYDKSQRWALDSHRVPSIAIDDVWTLLKEDYRLLRECLSFLGRIHPQKTAIIIPAGSPCQDLTVAGSSSGGLGLLGDRSQHMLVLYAILLAFQSIEPSILQCVHIFLENAGSMKPIHQGFIQQIFGIRDCCCHHIAGATFGHVERKRKFFTRYGQIGTFSNRPTPWFQGWRPVAEHMCGIKSPGEKLKPWLRPKRFDRERGLRLAAYFYHPSALLYHVPSFGGAEAFQRQFSQAANTSNGVPNLQWEKFVPDGPIGLRFVTDVQKLSLQADVPSLAAMDRFAEANYELLRAENAFLIGDSGIPPFRVAHYKEMLRDAELDIWLADVEEHINDMCIASIVGNCFYPGALKAAIKHTSLRELLNENPDSHWKPLPLSQFLQYWPSYGQQVLAATTAVKLQDKFSHKFHAPFPCDELNAVGWLKQGLIVNKPVVLEYTPGQGKFQGIRESASGIPRGISFVTETRFHQTQDLLQEKGIPSAIQRVLQIVDPQLQLLCGSRRNVMANLCRETVANLGAKFALHFLDFPAQGWCLISFLKALHLEFVAYRDEFIPQFLLVKGQQNTLYVQHLKDANAGKKSPPVDFFLYVEQDDQCALAMLNASQARDTVHALTQASIIEVVDIERRGASPGTFLHKVIEENSQLPTPCLIFEGNEAALHLHGHTILCSPYLGQRELFALFLTPYFAENYTSKAFASDCNSNEAWLSEVLRDFSCFAKLALPCRQAVYIGIDARGAHYTTYKQGTVHQQTVTHNNIPSTIPTQEKALRIYVYDRQPAVYHCFYGVHRDPLPL